MVLEACRENGFQPRVACESGQPETVRTLVAAGLGVAILPELALGSSNPKTSTLRLRDPALRRELGWIQRQGQPPSLAAQAFVELFASKRTPA